MWKRYSTFPTGHGRRSHRQAARSTPWTRAGETLLRSLDLAANNWETLPTGHDEGASPAQGGVNGIAVAADGTIYLSSGWAMATEDGYPFLERIQNGEAQRVQLDQKLYTGSDRLLFCALPSGGLIALSDMEAFRFSPDGGNAQPLCRAERHVRRRVWR